MSNPLHPEPLMSDAERLGESSKAPENTKPAKDARASKAKAEPSGKGGEPQSSDQVTIPLETWTEMVRLARIGEHSEQKTEAAENAEPAIAHAQAVQAVPEAPRPFAEMVGRPPLDFNAYKLAATVAALRAGRAPRNPA